MTVSRCLQVLPKVPRSGMAVGIKVLDIDNGSRLTQVNLLGDKRLGAR